MGKRVILLLGIFLVLTLVTGVHLHNSFKKVLEMPENIPSFNENIPEGFWMDFGLVYYFSPVKTIALTFGFYSVGLFLVDSLNRNLRNGMENTIVKNNERRDN